LLKVHKDEVTHITRSLTEKFQAELKTKLERYVNSFKTESDSIRNHYHLATKDGETVNRIMKKLQRTIMEQEQLLVYARKYLQDRNLRMVYKVIGAQIPVDVGALMGLDELAVERANRYDYKVLTGSLGFVETAMSKTSRFEGEGLPEMKVKHSKTEYIQEIERLKDRTTKHKIKAKVERARNEALQLLNEELNKTIERLQTNLVTLEHKTREMQTAFNLVKQGRENELEEIRLVYFDKQRTLMKNFTALRDKFIKYRSETEREITMKD
jgi:hypothetical protein